MNRITTALFLLALTVNSVCASPPNVLLIIADDYGADSSSLYNTNAAAVLPPTPNLVALAQNGVLFRNAYANPVCSPTRACVITGRHGFRTGIGDVIAGAGSATLTAGDFTLPEAFAANNTLGYQLAQFGKWHLVNGPNSPGTIGGWPHFAGSLIGAITSYTNWNKTVNGTSSTSTNYATTDIVNDAVAWIQARGSNPWFAWVAFNAPHSPLHKPPNALCPHYTSLSGAQGDINANPRSYFAAMIEALDTEIGRLLAAVNLTNTHVIFMGDNGTMGNVIQPPYSSARGKNTLYESGIRVPFIVAGPSVVNPGRTNDTLIHAVDVFSTILDMATIDVAATIPTNLTIDSRSLRPILEDTSSPARHVYAEVFNESSPDSNDGRALRNAQFKLIQFQDGREEFYDLMTDPYEATNLLSRSLTSLEQANYYNLTMRFSDYQEGIPQTTITSLGKTNAHFSLTVLQTTNLTYSLWKAATLEEFAWTPVTNAIVTSNATSATFTDSNALGASAFYRVIATGP